MSWGKWIVGGLGFVLGGPIGAVIGFVLASLFESGVRSLPGGEFFGNDEQNPDEQTYEEQQRNYNGRGGGYEEQQRSYGGGTYGEQQKSYGGRRYTGGQNNNRQYRQGRPTQGDIRISILVLTACVMKADGHIKKQELDVVKKYLLKNYREEEAKEALQMLKGLLNQNINHQQVAQQIKVNVNYSTRLEILHFLIDLAYADGEYASQEEFLIEQISRNLGLSDADYRSILALYGKKKDPNWAYTALEIDPSATNEEVKKAYRRMAMKYHPDKVASAGDDVKQRATEKFRAINEAYEYIKMIRGMK